VGVQRLGRWRNATPGRRCRLWTGLPPLGGNRQSPPSLVSRGHPTARFPVGGLRPETAAVLHVCRQKLCGVKAGVERARPRSQCSPSQSKPLAAIRAGGPIQAGVSGESISRPPRLGGASSTSKQADGHQRSWLRSPAADQPDVVTRQEVELALITLMWPTTPPATRPGDSARRARATACSLREQPGRFWFAICFPVELSTATPAHPGQPSP